MRKKLVSCLTAALTVGMANAAAAASNPFSDVPSDHWSYDAVTELASDGVINGYGDGTFRGDKHITRYEMAQMVAKAMAKSDVSAKDKALIDKLAAEFSDELNSLGVRVANLEKHADMVKWTGELRQFYVNDRTDIAGGGHDTGETARAELRLFPTAEVNDHWQVKARLTGQVDLTTDAVRNNGSMQLTYAYAQGTYDKFGIALGKMSNYSYNDEGLVTDAFFSGVQLTYGKELQGILELGRYNMASIPIGNATLGAGDTPNYQGLQLNYNKDKVFAGLGYRHFGSDGFKQVAGYSKNNAEDSASIWSVGASYRFDDNFALSGAYAKNTAADNYDQAASVKLAYKGAKRKEPGTWGAWLAYRHISPFVSLAPTYETYFSKNDRKGWEIGAQYVPAKNITAEVQYLNGKTLTTDQNSQTFFGRVRFFF